MEWYVVIKTINGHRYRYRQKTWREGDRVRTRSEYIGPADGPTSARPTPVAAKIVPTIPAPSMGETVGASLNALLGRQSKDWDHAWSARRRGPSLVKRNAKVDKTLRALQILYTHSISGAYYSPLEDVVNIPPTRCFFDTEKQTAAQAFYVVLFHELVHWTGRGKRLDRLASGGRGEAYAREELVAELGAVTLMKHFGLDVGDAGRHARYFQSWLERAGNRERALEHAAREAERSVRYILERGRVRA